MKASAGVYAQCFQPSQVGGAVSRMIVGWQLAGHMRADLVLDALRMALHRRGPGADVELDTPDRHAHRFTPA